MVQAQALLRKNSRHHPVWQRVFGNGPLQVQDTGDNSVFIVDADSLSPVQYERLLRFCVEKWGLLPSVAALLIEYGFPMLVEDIEPLGEFDLEACA